VVSGVRELYENPYIGKRLRDELSGFRSLRMKRYRAIYQIDNIPNCAFQRDKRFKTEDI
jgi:mRNA-degrading endonuclease RelE of RelBE toxin-antitoxin system